MSRLWGIVGRSSRVRKVIGALQRRDYWDDEVVWWYGGMVVWWYGGGKWSLIGWFGSRDTAL
jgi:hypothetical protein